MDVEEDPAAGERNPAHDEKKGGVKGEKPVLLQSRDQEADHDAGDADGQDQAGVQAAGTAGLVPGLRVQRTGLSGKVKSPAEAEQQTEVQGQKHSIQCDYITGQEREQGK